MATNSFCQGQQVPITWAILLSLGLKIRFAHTSFIWKNLAAHNAGVTVIVVGLDRNAAGGRTLFSNGEKITVSNINPYLTSHHVRIVQSERRPLSNLPSMQYGVYYSKSEGLILDVEAKAALKGLGLNVSLMPRFLGSTQFINGVERYCLWLSDGDLKEASEIPEVAKRMASVRADRLATSDHAVQKLAATPHQFASVREMTRAKYSFPS